MKSDSRSARSKRGSAEEEELETGEPIPGEDEAPAAKKIPARRGKFDGNPPAQNGAAAPGGHMVLSSAKYLKTSPENQDSGKKKGSAAEPETTPSSLEGKLLNGGTGLGALAMGGAALVRHRTDERRHLLLPADSVRHRTRRVLQGTRQGRVTATDLKGRRTKPRQTNAPQVCLRRGTRPSM